eukprot:scaffold41429_cov44-Phaeocystis_antarctica.AAC.1
MRAVRAAAAACEERGSRIALALSRIYAASDSESAGATERRELECKPFWIKPLARGVHHAMGVPPGAACRVRAPSV